MLFFEIQIDNKPLRCEQKETESEHNVALIVNSTKEGEETELMF